MRLFHSDGISRKCEQNVFKSEEIVYILQIKVILMQILSEIDRFLNDLTHKGLISFGEFFLSFFFLDDKGHALYISPL